MLPKRAFAVVDVFCQWSLIPTSGYQFLWCVDVSPHSCIMQTSMDKCDVFFDGCFRVTVAGSRWVCPLNQIATEIAYEHQYTRRNVCMPALGSTRTSGGYELHLMMSSLHYRCIFPADVSSQRLGLKWVRLWKNNSCSTLQCWNSCVGAAYCRYICHHR